jgi:hypothetical protein
VGPAFDQVQKSRDEALESSNVEFSSASVRVISVYSWSEVVGKHSLLLERRENKQAGLSASAPSSTRTAASSANSLPLGSVKASSERLQLERRPARPSAGQLPGQGSCPCSSRMGLQLLAVACLCCLLSTINIAAGE